jgi:hypothetical protein
MGSSSKKKRKRKHVGSWYICMQRLAAPTTQTPQKHVIRKKKGKENTWEVGMYAEAGRTYYRHHRSM